jgi:hypothetical protein
MPPQSPPLLKSLQEFDAVEVRPVLNSRGSFDIKTGAEETYSDRGSRNGWVMVDRNNLRNNGGVDQSRGRLEIRQDFADRGLTAGIQVRAGLGTETK